MLVFISDIHLTDGSSGETIKSTAFKIFSDNLKQLVKSVKKSNLEEVKLVLLGDIFDVIRSTKWNDPAVTVRPWDEPSKSQEDVLLNILSGIYAQNQNSLNYFDDIRKFAKGEGIPFDITYVIGNHDWLVNRYQNSRNLIAKWLGLPSNNAPKFSEELFDTEYKTYARHGDIYDSFNYMNNNRDASSIGDAIVIELLNKYPLEVEKRLDGLLKEKKITDDEKKKITDMLKELDNVRPILDTPSWVMMVMNRTTNASAKQAIEKAWSDCVNSFFKVPFIKNMDKLFWPDTIDLLQIALNLSSQMSKWALEKIMELKKRISSGEVEGDYDKRAFAEPKIRSGEASFVLYGHTHDYLIIPLDQIPTDSGKIQNKINFNTGTWRKTWNKAVFESINREFIGWHVLTYVGIFKPTENGDYNFEIWNSALG